MQRIVQPDKITISETLHMLHIFRSLRQFHVKTGGAFFIAGNPYISRMALGDLLCHHQSEARTILIAMITAPVEFIKYVLVF